MTNLEEAIKSGAIRNVADFDDECDEIITEGSHSWNLANYGNGMIRECPVCGGEKIRDDKCMRCGYTPGDDPFGKRPCDYYI
jgi:hypothetical protein